MTTRTTAICAAVSLTALTLAGCGPKPSAPANATAAASDKPAAAAAGPFNPCGVLTSDAVAAVTGIKVTKTEVIDHDCHYDDAVNDDGTVLSIYRTGGQEQMQAIRESNKLLGGIGAAVSQQGDVGKAVQASITPPAQGGAPALGDEAVWQPNAALAVRKGDIFVGVRPPIVQDPANHQGVMISDADKRRISQKLAEETLAKLGH